MCYCIQIPQTYYKCLYLSLFLNKLFNFFACGMGFIESTEPILKLLLPHRKIHMVQKKMTMIFIHQQKSKKNPKGYIGGLWKRKVCYESISQPNICIKSTNQCLKIWKSDKRHNISDLDFCTSRFNIFLFAPIQDEITYQSKEIFSVAHYLLMTLYQQTILKMQPMLS